MSRTAIYYILIGIVLTVVLLLVFGVIDFSSNETGAVVDAIVTTATEATS